METGSQAEFLASEGCDEVQGYHYGRPMAAAEIESMIVADQPINENSLRRA
ncbi:hypothetical protein DF3PB_2180008 [uncultured Defluviicoccus sp.]|uniref:EAL domain-containing protein n=1 Tax=metagenome TaxID=256318 RepID=A0A380TC63_9ZZZZ|nr:hypothetical protein DF3PB_2180008 [uncultured Defluviicoccus sp.]